TTAFPSNSWVSQSCVVHIGYLRYSRRLWNDPQVGFLFLATTVQTSFAIYYAWQTIVVSWSKIQVDPRVKDYPFVPFDGFDEATIVLPVIDGIISAAVQIFFSWRIWFLNQTTVGRIFAALISIVAVFQFITSMILFNMPGGILTIPMVWLASNFIADVLIASSMLYAVSSVVFMVHQIPHSKHIHT
ncbi:hypothetical protein BD779DRAFT_1562514, partial [Infundibulicybe gibba]